MAFLIDGAHGVTRPTCADLVQRCVESDKRKNYNVQIRRAQRARSHAYRSLLGHGTAGILALAHCHLNSKLDQFCLGLTDHAPVG